MYSRFFVFFCSIITFCILLVSNAVNVYADFTNPDELFRGEAALGVLFSEPSGNTSYTVTDPGTNLDLNSDLGFSEENAFFGRLKFIHNNRLPDVSLNAYYFDYEGSGNINPTFGDQNFDDGEFDSSLSASIIDLSMYFPLKTVSVASFGKIKVDLGGTLRWSQTDIELKESDLGVQVDNNEYAASLYADILYRPFRGLEFAVEAKMVPLTSAKFSNLTARVSYNFTNFMFASLGYMTDSIEMDASGYEIDLDTKGTFFELGSRF